MKTLVKYTALLALALAAMGCPQQLGIQAVILSDDNGSNQAPITLQQIDIWVDAANDTYMNHGFELIFDHNDVAYVSNTFLNSVPVVPDGWQPDPLNGIFFNDQQIYDMWANSIGGKYPDKIVVLFRARGGGGWSWGPPDLRYISMPSYTHTGIGKPTPGSPNDTLFAHEAGHYLGLAHTFSGVGCGQATPSNTDGDFLGQDSGDAQDDVIDTNPDPGAACAPTTSLTCPEGTVMVNGFTFEPPWRNIMTYHDCLPENISLDQRRAMNHTLQHPMRSAIPQ